MNGTLATSDLAAGFAANAAGWAGNRGAPADSIEALMIAAACVGDATAQGSACVRRIALSGAPMCRMSAPSALGDWQA